MDFLAGWKTLIAAVGLLGLALHQFSQGDIPGAWESLMLALAAFGLKMAVERSK